MASNVKPRLEALAVYLEQCENEGNFHDLRKQQFDLLLGSLETQLAALDFSDGAENAAILRSMSTFCVLTNAPRYISHDFQLALTVRIFLYLFCGIFMWTVIAQKLLEYLYMYLYVSLCIFMYLLKPVQKIPKDTNRYMYLLEKNKRYKKIQKDTLRYIQIQIC